ncbi:MAG TPA: hypothetical protein VK662_09670 [Acidothermaceae bacterium]|jgi:hypothetical protein|nr:hypothetical protein [Acidothermaceae bacterium]
MTQHGADAGHVGPAASTDVVGYDSPNGLATHAYAPDNEPPPPPLARVGRRKLPLATLVLALLAFGAAGFFVGVKVEKSKLPVSNTAATRAAAFGAGATGTGAAAARASGAAGAGATGAAGTGAAGTGAAGTGAAGTGAVGGAANIVGTVTVVDGTTLYVTDATGDTVKVTTNTGTTVTKTDTGTVSSLAPGETVVIRGVQSSAGVYAAQTVSEGSAASAFTGGGFGGRGTRAGATAAPTAAASAGN